MSIPRITLHACLSGMLLTGSALVSADESQWDGSYAANGQCFCVGAGRQEIDSLIVPTPIGGQSIAQVCERVGSGPKLRKTNGKFNFTVYADRHCGNNTTAQSSLSNAQCAGHLGVAGEDCKAAGPKWDLASAYQEDQAFAVAGITDSTVVDGISRHIKPPVNAEGSKQAKASGMGSGSESSVKQIVQARKSATKLNKRRRIVDLTPQEIIDRQEIQLTAARERARLRAESGQSAVSTVTIEYTTSVVNAESVAATDSAPVSSDEQSIDATTSVINEAIAASKQVAEEATAAPTLAAAETETASAPVVLSALQFPISLDRGSRDFNFIEASPSFYDFGGAGLRLTASRSSHNRMQYVLRAAAQQDYEELGLGLGFFVSPSSMPRVTFMMQGGVEAGRLGFRDDTLEAELASTGAFLELASRIAITSKLRLQGGLGYSSFFEGDLLGYGEALFNLNSNFDLSTRVEAGDNDLFGVGFRYHY